MKYLIICMLLCGCGTRVQVKKTSDGFIAKMNAIGKFEIKYTDKDGGVWEVKAESKPSSILPEIPSLLNINLGKKED